MGITADLLNVKSLGPSADRSGLQRILHRYMDRLIAAQGDPGYINRDAVTDEIQTIAIYSGSVSGGNFTLTIKVFNGETATTANIAHDAIASVIETAIDVAATSIITGWTNGDISVSGGDLINNPVLLTYDGASVAGQKHFDVVITDVDLSGGGTVGTVITFTTGQPNRPALGMLNLIGAINDTQPIGTLPSDSDYNTANPGSLHLNPPEVVLQMLADEAGIEVGIVGVGGAAVRDEHLRLMRVQGFAV